jgi:pyruvate,water dikinase
MHLTNLFKHWTYQVFSPGTVLRGKYEAFKSLLNADKKAHELMAELEEIYHHNTKVDFKVIENKYEAFAKCVASIIEDLGRMSPSRYLDLKDYFKKFDFYIKFMLAPPAFTFSPPFTLPLNEIPFDNALMTGNKTQNLAMAGQQLHLRIPRGFVITTHAFYYFIEFNNLRKFIDDILVTIDVNAIATIDNAAAQLTEKIMRSPVPPDIEESIFQTLGAINWDKEHDIRLALRSSAVAEDSQSSFAGQYRTVLNVGKDGVLNAYKAVIASKYSASALFYRISYGLSDIETPMAVLALEMINAEASGIIYTRDLENVHAGRMQIYSVWGLGESLVDGEQSSDTISISLQKDQTPRIIKKQTRTQTTQTGFSKNRGTGIVPVPEKKQTRHSLEDQDALKLAEWGMKLESFFKDAQDIEWCRDGQGRFYLLQSRPLKKEEIHEKIRHCHFKDVTHPVLISGGEMACSGIGAGKVFNAERESDLEKIPQGAVLVARNASPDYVKVIDKLNAVVTDIGSKAGHFSSVAREFGVPTLVNTGNATIDLSHGKEVTVYADEKMVYDGIVPAMVESPCARKNLMATSPFMRKLKYIMSFISPLRLVDPQDPCFVPHGVRSLHDIVRFAHEMAMREMFLLGEKRLRKIGGSKKLISEIPMLLYVLDVGGGLRQNPDKKKTVEIADLTSIPMTAVLNGLQHPGIHWSDFTHFNWSEYDKIAMSGGIISAESAMLASYAVISYDYLNLNLKFGYHFVILDVICGEQAENNYIQFRFSGGGDDMTKRMLRADFLKRVLDRLGFKVSMRSDLIDAKIKGEVKSILLQKLEMTGRLLGATRLMDMYLKDSEMVERYVEEFLNGRYHFATVEE